MPTVAKRNAGNSVLRRPDGGQAYEQRGQQGVCLQGGLVFGQQREQIAGPALLAKNLRLILQCFAQAAQQGGAAFKSDEWVGCSDLKCLAQLISRDGL